MFEQDNNFLLTNPNVSNKRFSVAFDFWAIYPKIYQKAKIKVFALFFLSFAYYGSDAVAIEAQKLSSIVCLEYE